MRTDANPFSRLPVVVKNLLILERDHLPDQVTGLGNFGGANMDTWFALHYSRLPCSNLGNWSRTCSCMVGSATSP